MTLSFHHFLCWLRGLGYGFHFIDASSQFPYGFNTPFNCPFGIVHEVYAVRVYAKRWAGDDEMVYHLRAEVEELEEEPGDRAALFDYRLNPQEYLEQNPHCATKRTVRSVWVAREVLEENAIKVPRPVIMVRG